MLGNWMSHPDLLPWVGFAAIIVALLLLDQLVLHRRIHTPSIKESLGWTVFWIALALVFNGYIWWSRGSAAGLEFATGYLIEKALSIDNLFVFAVVFRFFRVEIRYQQRVLFWGVLGAIVLRLIFILLGTALVRQFAWVMPLFGLFLLYTGVKLAWQHGDQVDPDKNWLLHLARRWFPVARQDHAQRFFVWENGRRCITPLFLVLLVIESTDVLFAVDSLPAIFGITRDPYVIFTSNIFAILGLRALYFVLASALDLFHHLVYGLSAVLGFIGLKMVAEYFVPHEGEHWIPTWASLLVVAGLIGAAIVASLLHKKAE